MTDTFTTRGIGDNVGVDIAETVTDRLSRDFTEQRKTLDELLAEASRRIPTVASDPEALARGSLIKRFRDLDTRLESHREAEKNPFLRGGNAVDNFFFGLRDLIARRKKGDRSVKPGIIDVMQSEINDWQDQKEAAERARLEAERAETARLAAIEAARLRKLQEEAEEAERALARARSEATRALRVAEAKAAIEAEAYAKAQADLAREQAEEARLATLVKPADITRTRGTDSSGAGVLLTSAKEPYALLVDRQLIDMNALRPYFTDAEIEKALRGWAKATGHKVQMPGAEIGVRSKGVTR
jgi:hypothetical protein